MEEEEEEESLSLFSTLLAPFNGGDTVGTTVHRGTVSAMDKYNEGEEGGGLFIC